MRKRWILVCPGAICALILSLAGCTSDNTAPTNPSASLEAVWIATLPNLVFLSTAYFPIQVEIKEANPNEIDSVKAAISPEGGQNTTQFHLYDDAGAFEQNDAPGFCSSFSGDLVAHNGTFSRLVNSHFAGAPGTFLVQVTAWVGTHSVQTSLDTISVFPSSAPQVSDLYLPDTLASGFAQVQISLLAYDPNAPESDSIAAVEMKLYSPAGQLIMGPVSLNILGSSLYGINIGADFALGLPSGMYGFAFFARDTYNMVSDSLGKTVFLENLGPFLADPAYPASVQRPAPGTAPLDLLLALRVWDDQTEADIESVSMISLKPDGTYANGGQPIPLADNGLPFDPAKWAEGYLGDLIAADSLFSTTAVLYDTSLVGTYIFTFSAVDLVGNMGSPFMDSLIVIP